MVESVANKLLRRGIHPPQMQGVDTERAFSYGFQAGNMVWVSGMVPVDKNGDVVGVGDIEAQAEQCFEHVKSVVEEAGGTLNHVVKLTCYLTDPAHRLAMQSVRRRYFRAPYPASILLYQPLIVNPQILIEVDALAVL